MTKNNTSRTWIEKLTSFVAREPQTRDQLMEVLRDAEGRGVLKPEMLGMMECILQVSEMQVREVMVPTAQMVTINKNSTLNEILPIVIESAHSRFPVIDPNRKDIVGILLAKDLLKFCYSNQPEEFDMSKHLRPATFTPQSKRLDILLREFRVNRNHMAIVLDEYGHVAGLVTIEDILEQIVGDIEDEYDVDEEDAHIKKIDVDTFIVRASTAVKEFNEYFKTNFEDTELDTIGGIVLQAFGHLPRRGETIKLQHVRFKVLHSDNRRLHLLEVKAARLKKKE